MMGTKGIDVILGINWLDKYQVVIICDKKTVKLVSPLGEEVVTKLVSPEPRKGSCHQMAIDSKESYSLEIIKVVSGDINSATTSSPSGDTNLIILLSQLIIAWYLSSQFIPKMTSIPWLPITIKSAGNSIPRI